MFSLDQHEIPELNTQKSCSQESGAAGCCGPQPGPQPPRPSPEWFWEENTWSHFFIHVQPVGMPSGLSAPATEESPWDRWGPSSWTCKLCICTFIFILELLLCIEILWDYGTCMSKGDIQVTGLCTVGLSMRLGRTRASRSGGLAWLPGVYVHP